MSRLTVEQLEALPTKRLKSHLNKEQSRIGGFFCSCCSMAYFEIYDNPEQEKEYNDLKSYLYLVHQELNKRKDKESVVFENKIKNSLYQKRNKRKGKQSLTNQKKKLKRK